MKFISFVFALVAVMSYLAYMDEYEIKPTPAPVEEIPPEQSHYAVFYTVCGALQSILMTTEPLLIAVTEEQTSQEMLDLLEATPLERMLELRYAGPECFYYHNKPSKEPIL